MKEELVWINRIYTTNQISDWIQEFRNLIGGRLKAYEKMMDKAIGEAWNKFKEKFPKAIRVKVDTESMVEGSVMVTVTGVVINDK